MSRAEHCEASPLPVRPCEIEVGEMDNEDFEELTFEEVESEEGRQPEVLRDPGAPTSKDIEEHNVTHIPFRSWCPHCVTGKAQDRPHRMKKEAQMDKQVPEIVFDYGFFGGKEDEETLALRPRRRLRSTTRLIFHSGHGAPIA